MDSIVYIKHHEIRYFFLLLKLLKCFLFLDRLGMIILNDINSDFLECICYIC